MLTYDTPTYMFNYKNQPSRQTGRRNVTDRKTLSTIWGTYMKLVTKYQISSINSCWEKCDEKYLRTDGRTDRDRDKTVYPPPLFVKESEQNEQSQQRTFHRCFLPSFSTFGQTVSEEKNLKHQPIWNKNRLWRPYLLMDRDRMKIIYRGPSIDASYQVSDHLFK